MRKGVSVLYEIVASRRVEELLVIEIKDIEDTGYLDVFINNMENITKFSNYYRKIK